MKYFFLIFLSFGLGPMTWAETLFEGYYRIEESGKHIGYTIQRYSFDPKTKNRTISTYLRRKIDEDQVHTFIKSVSTERTTPKGKLIFVPFLSEYSSNETGDNFRMSANFKNQNKPKVEFFFDNARKPSDIKIETGGPNSFLSNFLYYLVAAQNSDGDVQDLPLKRAIPYQAFSEDDGNYSDGFLYRIADKIVSGLTVLQIADRFAGETLESFVLPSGDMVGVRNNKTIVYLVRDRAEAVGLLDFPQNEVTQFFGELPEGQKNPLSPQGINAYKIIKSFRELHELLDLKFLTLEEPDKKTSAFTLPVLKPEPKAHP